PSLVSPLIPIQIGAAPLRSLPFAPPSTPSAPTIAASCHHLLTGARPHDPASADPDSPALALTSASHHRYCPAPPDGDGLPLTAPPRRRDAAPSSSSPPRRRSLSPSLVPVLLLTGLRRATPPPFIYKRDPETDVDAPEYDYIPNDPSLPEQPDDRAQEPDDATDDYYYPEDAYYYVK
uniref:Uncharacterized protein n=1 Tax=Triticum urartu TaxID=4572 RepID=A0A8R7K1P4_TRIUA